MINVANEQSNVGPIRLVVVRIAGCDICNRSLNKVASVQLNSGVSHQTLLQCSRDAVA